MIAKVNYQFILKGINDAYSGQSVTFGCSWSMYFDGCKYGQAGNRTHISKFRLRKETPDEIVKANEHILQQLATIISPVVKNVAPESYDNMTAFENVADDCRIGLKRGKPFSGVTAVSDFCAHGHRDNNDIDNGCTVVLTLTKPENHQIGSK